MDDDSPIAYYMPIFCNKHIKHVHGKKSLDKCGNKHLDHVVWLNITGYMWPQTYQACGMVKNH